MGLSAGDKLGPYRRSDFGRMEAQFLIEDPGTFVKPWKANLVWDLAPQEDILENVCAESNSYSRHAGK